MSATSFNPEPFLKTLTKKPGVYRMVGADENALYIGKARNLKNRVTSYFRAKGLQAKTMAMVAKVQRIDITVTQSETEALLLEQSLIKQERPPYNVVLRDDKSYPYIYLADEEDFPRLTFHRGSNKRKGKYFGPFPSAYAVRDSINILQKVFQLRNCDESYFKNRTRPCLQHQIQRCTAPCVDAVSIEDYQSDVELAVMFLEGKSQSVLDRFKEKMDAHANALEFEKAARVRDQISHLRKVQESQFVHGQTGDDDVFVVVSGKGHTCLQSLFIRGGRLIGQRTFFPKNELQIDEADLLAAFIAQFYLASSGRDVPKSILLSHNSKDAELLAEVLSERVGRKVAVSSSVRGQRAQWLSLAGENAKMNLASYVADRRNIFARFVALQDALEMETIPQRLECFDISHTMGEATVASCVVFDSNGPLKSDYRRFNIENVTPGDDYGAMEQALRRRYTRIKKGEAALPDLLVIDGGKGQLGVAKAILAELQVEDVQILGIAKGPERRPDLERYFQDGQEVNMTTFQDAVHLLQHIRDEAHRFAITGHRQRRAKKRNRSELEDIAGVGPKRRRDLLTHFGGLAGIKGASVDEIAKVPGLSKKLAQEIYESVHG